MSVIASNSVNFVPIYQLLKNVSDVKPKEMPNEQLAEKSGQILDVAELSNFHKIGQVGQSNPISSNGGVGELPNFVVQEKVLESKQKQLDLQTVAKNTDSARSFIIASKEKAVAQQANQSKQNVIVLI